MMDLLWVLWFSHGSRGVKSMPFTPSPEELCCGDATVWLAVDTHPHPCLPL